MAELEAQGGGAQEPLGADDEGGPSAEAQFRREAFGQFAGPGGGCSVDSRAYVCPALRRFHAEQPLGEVLAEPFPGDRFESHLIMMPRGRGTGQARPSPKKPPGTALPRPSPRTARTAILATRATS